MAEFHLKTTSTPSENVSYPPTFQGLIDLLSTYLYFDDKISFKSYVKSTTNPTPISQTFENIWFQLDGNGAPIAVFEFANPNWKEFQYVDQGDLVLTPATSTIASPWGLPGQTYSVITYSGSGSSTTSYTAPSAPPPPAGFKYKVFVGRY
jgi:hypothetical protein